MTPGERVWIDWPGSPWHERIGTLCAARIGESRLVVLDGDGDRALPVRPSRVHRLPVKE